ncbi:helicase-related protein [Desulfomonile tiedjei]|uniref:DNA/RNA helicase, superfamily II, SNF2 family n=1 Tax=Desulfomonile tiedjei (strain ATCC 49306 / DSM 6799 / DCB-1) TaxID=706587 RepID=I4C925_DESTA|nr:helicase-related protein [Desulfomonile tiedjei]AFM26066.1 DNA/RNA helicase, superfamily II, SNF2 family [Desulfomonile tiedjei DSM 6799]
MLESINDVNGYLHQFGGALAQKTQTEAEPLFKPGDSWHPRMHQLKRKPFQAQADAIQGAVETLRTHNHVMCIGEMGVGKTLIGAAVPYIMENGHPPRVLVMCPGHLTRKWVREVRETVPGAEADIITSLSAVQAIDPREPHTGLRYYVVSKERAKLSYAWRPAFNLRRGIPVCPDCGATVVDRDGVEVSVEALQHRKARCGTCGAALWQADNTRFRRFSIADYVKRHLKGYFDFFICDEVHEMKGGDTAQGNAFGTLASACKKTIALTGTLLGGYASHMFHLQYRMSPRAMNADGFSYGNRMNFVNRYGVLEKVTRYYPGDDNICSKGRKGATVTREKPGVSPAIFSNHLMGSTVFLHLQDIAVDLPSLKEEVVPVAMEDDLSVAYKDLEHRIGSEMKRLLVQGSRRLLGAYLNTLLCYTDRPFHNEPVVDPANGNVIAEPAHLAWDRTYPKERELLRIVQGEISRNRRCFVYCTYTNTKDVTGRLKEILARRGICAEIIRSSVKPEQREEWLRQKVRDDVQVVIGNPILVQTGLDLLDFPTIIFYQTGYSVFTLRQASRRSWRIGQEEPVRIHYLHYAGTMQERALELVGRKLSASLAIEGKLTDDGLASMCGGEDMTLLLAKALVGGTHIQGAESVWRALNQLREAASDKNVIPFLRKNWSLELLEERSDMLREDFLDILAHAL